jgi:ribokinase
MILVAGSANLDFVVRAPHIPRPGETVLGRGLELIPGGKGANQAIACARAGGAGTEMLLALGEDAFAASIESSLAGAGVRLHTVRVADQRTGTAFICVSDDGENAITVASGANYLLRGTHLPDLTGFSHLLMQLETPVETVTAYARAAREQQVTVVLNAAPAQKLATDLLRLIDVLVVNEGELQALALPRASIATSLEHIATPCVVVTLGRRGCCARQDGRYLTHPGFDVNCVDTTAAGDTFCGVLVAELSRRQDLARALRTASAAGALACTKLGAQSSIPTFAEVAQFLQHQPAIGAPDDAELRKYCGFI